MFSFVHIVEELEEESSLKASTKAGYVSNSSSCNNTSSSRVQFVAAEAQIII